MKKKFLKILSIVLLAFVTTNAYATDIAEAGNTVMSKGEHSSSRFVAGNSVTDTANVDGIDFVAGNEITLNGKATYGFFAGNNINVNQSIEKDMFVAGNHINVSADAILPRDVYILGNTVIINSNVGRDLRVGASIVDLSDITISGNAYVMADQITLNEKTNIVGKLTYSEDSQITGIEKAKIGSTEKVKKADINYTITIKDRIIDFILSVIAASIVILVLFYIIPKSKDKLDKFELKLEKILKTSLIGFIILIVLPLISIIAIFTRILLPLALILLAIYAICIYLAFLFTYYVVGNIISNKLLNKDNAYISIIIGIILVKLLSLVPYIGDLIGFISLVFGLGIICNFIKNIREK